MIKKVKKATRIFALVIILIIAIITNFFIIKHSIEINRISSVYEEYSKENIQNKLKKDDVVISDDLMLQIDGENVIGVINIEKINFEGLIYKGTSDSTLDKGVGHIESSAYFDGNVCLAAHNSKKFWKNLHTLEYGDLITYTSFLGKKVYKVNKITEIDETDWSLLQQNSNENLLTLITCVKGRPNIRLVVQGIEVD